MVNVLSYAASFYVKNLKLILLFSLSFIIALSIPIFASFPTFKDLGGIFVRTASIIQFNNLNAVSVSVIAVSVLLSSLFLSFAIVSINVLVKHDRTYTKIKQEVLSGLEKYTGKVFLILLAFTSILLVINIVSSSYGLLLGGVMTSIAGLILTPFFFYAPSSIVIDENKTTRAIKASLKFFFKRFEYFLLWIALAIVLITFFDFIFIAIGGQFSMYIMLIFSSLFVMPFLVVLQSEFYMKKFALLHY